MAHWRSRRRLWKNARPARRPRRGETPRRRILERRGRAHEPCRDGPPGGQDVKPVLIAGVVVVNLALLSYTVGIFTEQRRRAVTGGVLPFLTLGVCFDVAATGCMIAGSQRSLFTLHGFLGYSALAAMLVDTVLIWRHARRSGTAPVPGPLHLYSRFAYAWWLVAYVTGAALVAASHATV
jgi:hypothetical protein